MTEDTQLLLTLMEHRLRTEDGQKMLMGFFQHLLKDCLKQFQGSEEYEVLTEDELLSWVKEGLPNTHDQALRLNGARMWALTDSSGTVPNTPFFKKILGE